MKQIYLTTLALFVAGLSFAQVMLVDQTNGIVPNGLVAQDFEAVFNGNDCRIADDFTVATGATWYIDSVKIYGFYNVSNPDSAGMNFTIYNDNSGNIGTQVYTQLFSNNLDADGDGAITAIWEVPLQLSAGTYWMAASARKDYSNDQGVWYWYLDSAGSGYEAKWENPGGSWNVCTSWTNITASSCVGVAYPDVVFRIYGCFGPTKPTINNLPEDTTFCEGPEISITATSNSSGVNFVWNTGDSTATISAGEAGTYVVTAYDPVTLCGATSSIYLDVIPSPSSTLENDTICEGQTRSFLSTCSSCNFNWSTGETTSIITVESEGWVSVTMTDTVTGCEGVDSAWLEIIELPAVEFLPSDPAHGCVGDTMFIGTVEDYHQYFWDNIGWTSLKTDPTVEVVANGTYYLTVTNELGCLTNDTLEVIFHTPPTPNVSIDYTNNWKTRLTADPGYQSYEWSNGDTDPIIIAHSTGAYTLTVTDEFGCEGVVSLYVITIPTGIEDDQEDGLKVYPNPTAEMLNIEAPNTGVMRVTVYDQMGRLLIEEQVDGPSAQLSLSELSSSQYLLVIERGDQQWRRLIVKQ